jgi:hypothetical protein
LKLISRDLIVRYGDKRTVATGFATYASCSEPILMHCYGWEDYSDAYDDYCISISRDNGKNWSEPQILLKGYDVPQGKIRYPEPTAFFDPDTGKLIVIANKRLHPNDTLDVDVAGRLVIAEYDSSTEKWSSFEEMSFQTGASLMVSFAFPLKTASGKIVFPAMTPVLNDNGKPLHYKDCWSPVDRPLAIIGEYGDSGKLSWRLGNAMAVDPEQNSRGISETAILQLSDGRIVSIGRGDNSMFPEKLGCKWLSFSSDDGMNWEDPVPLCFTSGEPVESGSNGSALFRSCIDGKLYWIGNIPIHGEKAVANSPRTALSILEVQEEPFALKRETIFVIDEKGYNDSPDTQLSNFRFYQDRESGEVVLFMVRYCVNGGKDWWRSDYYRYRVELD